MGLVTANVNKSLEIKNKVREKQISVKIFFVLITSSSQVELIFIFDILQLQYTQYCELLVQGARLKNAMASVLLAGFLLPSKKQNIDFIHARTCIFNHTIFVAGVCILFHNGHFKHTLI